MIENRSLAISRKSRNFFLVRYKSQHFLFQKILFRFRDYENHWYISPKPSIYNTLQRFLLRLVGYNINLRKISHWAIPGLFFTLFTSFFGLNSKILIIIRAEYLHAAAERLASIVRPSQADCSVFPHSSTSMSKSIISSYSFERYFITFRCPL